MYCGPRGSPAAHISSRTTACCHTEPSAPPCSAGQLSVSQPRAARVRQNSRVKGMARSSSTNTVFHHSGSSSSRNARSSARNASSSGVKSKSIGSPHFHVAQELVEPADERQIGHVGERHPGHLGRVVAGHRARRGLERGDREVEDHVVVRVLDALHPPEEAVDDHLHARLLVHLAHDRLVQRLAPLHVTTRHGPLALCRSPPPPDEQQRPQVGAHGSHRDRGCGHFARRWCMVRARAVKPWVSKKFLAARCPGRAAASTPTHPAARQCSTSVPMSTSPTPTARAGSSTNRSVTTPRRAPERSCSTTTAPKPSTTSSMVPTVSRASSRVNSAS